MNANGSALTNPGALAAAAAATNGGHAAMLGQMPAVVRETF